MPARGKALHADPQAPELDPSLTVVEHSTVTSNEEWEAERVVGADLTGVTAKNLRMTGCELIRVACTGAHFELLTLADVVVTDCELSGAVLSKSSLRRVEFRNCRMAGVVLSDSTLRDVRLVRCKLDGANFRFVNAEHVVFDDCSIGEGDFAGGQLNSVGFDGCDLRGSDFTQASATSTSFIGSALDGIHGVATLKGITIDSMQVLPLAMSVFGELGITIDDGSE